jgi:hypothetical protein
LWYIGPLRAMPTLDFMGSAPATATTHYPLIYLAVAAILSVAALAGRNCTPETASSFFRLTFLAF